MSFQNFAYNQVGVYIYGHDLLRRKFYVFHDVKPQSLVAGARERVVILRTCMFYKEYPSVYGIVQIYT